MTFRLPLLAAALTFVVFPTQAAFVEYSASAASTQTPFTTSLSVQKFDAGLGLLTGVTLSLAADVAARIDVFNATATPQGFTQAFANVPITLTVLTPDVFSLSTVAAATVASGMAAPGFNSFGGAPSTAAVSYGVASAGFYNYSGPGSLTFDLSAASGTGSFGGNALSGVFFGGAALADADFTVRYDYQAASAVPLPNSVWLLGAGLLGGLYSLGRSRRA